MPPEQPSQKVSSPFTSTTVVVGIGLLVIVVLAFLYLKVWSEKSPSPVLEVIPVVQETETTQPASSESESLGGEIYEKAQNPLDGKLETSAPVANPINDAYKNPFE